MHNPPAIIINVAIFVSFFMVTLFVSCWLLAVGCWLLVVGRDRTDKTDRTYITGLPWSGCLSHPDFVNNLWDAVRYANEPQYSLCCLLRSTALRRLYDLGDHAGSPLHFHWGICSFLLDVKYCVSTIFIKVLDAVRYANEALCSLYATPNIQNISSCFVITVISTWYSNTKRISWNN